MRKRLLSVFLVLWIPVVILPGANAAADETATSPLMTIEAAQAAVTQTMTSVMEIRGLDFKQEVPVEVLDDAQARDHAVKRFMKFYTEERIRAEEQAYILMGLLPEGTDVFEVMLDVLEEQAGGFYDPDTKSFYVLDDIPAAVAPIVVAHELTHALEDQHFDMDRRLNEVIHDADATFARSAIHEGSAMLVMNRYMLDAIAMGTLDPEALGSMAESEAGRAEKLNAMPPALTRSLLGSYLLGMSFRLRGNMLAMVDDFPLADVDRSYDDVPRSSEQILHPEKYWNPQRRDDPVDVGPANVLKVLGDGWNRVESGVLGELMAGVMVGAPTPSPSAASMLSEGKHWTNDAASGWDGDLWELWRRGDDAILVLKIEWDSAEDAAEFAAALAERDGTAWKVKGNRVAYVAGDTGKKTRALLKAALKP
jgi:hypothetical protein